MNVTFGAGGFRVRAGDVIPSGLDLTRVATDRLGDDPDRQKTHLLVTRETGAPTLLIAADVRPGFSAGVHLVPETSTLFVGAAEHVAVYDLETSTRKYLDVTPYAFLGWARHGAFVVMSGEFEVAAYDLYGTRVWAATIPPPWDYTVHGSEMQTIASGYREAFPLRDGPGDRSLSER